MNKKTIKMDDIIGMQDDYSEGENYYKKEKDNCKEERNHNKQKSSIEERKEKKFPHKYEDHHNDNKHDYDDCDYCEDDCKHGHKHDACDYDDFCDDEFIFDYDECDGEEPDHNYYTECCRFCENDDRESEFHCRDEYEECEEDDDDDSCMSDKKKSSCDTGKMEYEKGYECGFRDGYEKAKREVQEYIKNRKNRWGRSGRCR